MDLDPDDQESIRIRKLSTEKKTYYCLLHTFRDMRDELGKLEGVWVGEL